MQNLVEMQTTKNKDDLYKGSFVKNSNVYHIDYGNSFTSDQTLKVADGTLNVYFLTAENYAHIKEMITFQRRRRKYFLRYFTLEIVRKIALVFVFFFIQNMRNILNKS